MLDIEVIDVADTAATALDAARSQLLAGLSEPKSATMLATAFGLPRQRVNYHLRELERHGLVELVDERRKGNMTERLFQATARAYVISPAALGAVAPDPSRSPDRLSASWLLAVASQLVRDVGELVKGASHSRQRLATFTLDVDLRFASTSDRAAFAEELAATVSSLVSKYHHESAVGGRDHRMVVAIHPSPRSPRDAQSQDGT
jgi:DNA-binding transcriptional ArsR family regulator